MKKNKSSNNNHSLEEYYKKFKHDYDKGRILSFSEEEYRLYSKFRNKKVWKINNKYYEIPRIRFTNRVIIYCSLIALFLSLGGTALYFHVFQTFNINFECENCRVTAPKKVKRNQEYTTTIKIDNGYQINLDCIEVYINGNKNNDCWTFSYQSNLVNTFKIKSNTIKGDVNVKVKPIDTKLFEYGCAVDVDSVDQKSIKFYPKDKGDPVYIKDWQRYAFPVLENEELVFTFSAKEGQTIPTNIGMWMNGRYGREDVEVSITYTSITTCSVHVFPFVIKDNIQFRCK